MADLIAGYIAAKGKLCPACGSDLVGWDLPAAGCLACGHEWKLTLPETAPRQEITGWSRKSRARMVRALCELDYGPLLARDGFPAMVTLTYPGEWLRFAPDGKTVKRHLKAFQMRWERTWRLDGGKCPRCGAGDDKIRWFKDAWQCDAKVIPGYVESSRAEPSRHRIGCLPNGPEPREGDGWDQAKAPGWGEWPAERKDQDHTDVSRCGHRWVPPLLGPWKLEFQERGAPHIHLLTVIPPGLTPDGRQFNTWLSQTWTGIICRGVGDVDPEERRKSLASGTGVDVAKGLTANDPKRIALYFSKHGTFGAKEYQNEVPGEWQQPGKGPGRFWGHWGLRRCTASVEVAVAEAKASGELIRRWSAAGDRGRANRLDRDTATPRAERARRTAQMGPPVTREVHAPRGLAGLGICQCAECARAMRDGIDQAERSKAAALRMSRASLNGVGEDAVVASWEAANPVLADWLVMDAMRKRKRRKVRRRVRRFQGDGGFVSVNDGPAFAGQVARYLDGLFRPELPGRPWYVTEDGEVDRSRPVRRVVRDLP